MIAFVIDASALVQLTVGPAPTQALQRFAATGHGSAPEIIDLEALSTLRRMLRGGAIGEKAAHTAARRLSGAPIVRVTHRTLLARVWELRDSITAYDAAYIALAEQLDVPLLTCDARLGRAHGHDAEVIVYPRS